MKLRIVQLCTPNIDAYALYSLASVSHYADRHGYSHLVQRQALLGHLHINWSKIALLQRELKSSEWDYVVLLDADTVITHLEKPLKYFIERYGKTETAIWMPVDTPLSSKWQRKPNAGFIIIKNNAAGVDVIDRWLYAAEHEGKHLNNIHPRNQRVYWKYVMPYIREKQVVLPGRYFAKPLFVAGVSLHNPTRFLYHITSSDPAKRARLMASFLPATVETDVIKKKLRDSGNEFLVTTQH
jgi:hypothetical protein